MLLLAVLIVASLLLLAVPYKFRVASLCVARERCSERSHH